MRKTPVLVSLLLLMQTLLAQTPAINSLKQALQNKMPDTTRVLALNRLARYYGNSHPDSAMMFEQKGLSLARQIKFIGGEVVCLRGTGAIYTITGNYPQALKNCLESLKLADSIHDQENIAKNYINLGNLYAWQGDYRQAIIYEYRAKTVLEALINSRSIIISSLMNIGDCYEKSNQLDSALLYTQKAYVLSLSLKDIDATGITSNNFGNIYFKMNQLAIAKGYYHAAIASYRQSANEDGICESTLGLAKVFKAERKTDSSLYYAKLSLAAARRGGFTNYVLAAANFLTDYYKTIHDIDSAFAYQSKAITAKDSLFSQEKTRQIQNLSFAEMQRQQEMITAKAEEAQERHTNIQYAIIVIVIISFLVLFLLLSRSIIVHEKWIEFFGILGLLIVFEFINLVIHPYLSDVTNHSPVWMLLILVAIAAILVPMHHRVEHWITHRMIAKNKEIRLGAAKRMVARLEAASEEGAK